MAVLVTCWNRGDEVCFHKGFLFIALIYSKKLNGLNLDAFGGVLSGVSRLINVIRVKHSDRRARSKLIFSRQVNMEQFWRSEHLISIKTCVFEKAQK